MGLTQGFLIWVQRHTLNYLQDCVHMYTCAFIWRESPRFLSAFICLFVYLFIYLFIFGCVRSSLLCTGFLQLWRAGATLRCGARASHCGGFSCCRARALGTWASVVVAHGLQSAGSVVVVHGLSCSTTCGIFPDQGSNPCPLHWQAGS